MLKSKMQIRGLELCVNLGWPDNERSTEQVVLLDIDVDFATVPKACETDKLDDTYCYSKLTNTIRDHLAGKQIHLIERLTQEIYQTIKTQFPNDARVLVRLTKHPKIRGLTNGVTFEYGDAT